MARIVAVTPDAGFAHELATALMAAAQTVDVQRTLDSIDARGAGEPPRLAVIHIGHAGHVGGEPARDPRDVVRDAARAIPGCPVIAVLPRRDLAAALEVMQTSDRVAGVVVADDLDVRPLAAMATRLVGGELFGIDQALAPGTEIHACSVGDHAEKTECLSVIAGFVEQAGVPRRFREPIEQCVDEMVMNGLYDAPVDARGKHIFAAIPAKARMALRSGHSVVVQYACDSKRFAVSVRDAFGTLERQTVLHMLHKCLHGTRPVESKPGGAGLGLYLMVNSASAVHFHVVPGIATEAVCVFDLEAPRLALAQLGFLVQTDAGGRRAAGPARRLAATSLGARVRWLALAAGGATLVAAALPGGFGRRPAIVELDSRPTGAAVEIDGTPAGSTPLTLSSLEPGATLSIAFRRTGYRPAALRLAVPRAGRTERVVQSLEPSDEFVPVHFVSRPPGAEVVRTGEPAAADRTYTPADVFVEADQVQRFTLTMPRHVPLVIEPFTAARGARGLEKGGELADGATLRIAATLDGKVAVSGAPHCQDLALPADCTLAPGSRVVEYRGPGGGAITREVTMTDQDRSLQLELGIVEAAPGERLAGGSRSAVYEVGTQTVTVSGPGGSHRAVVTVTPGATVIAR